MKNVLHVRRKEGGVIVQKWEEGGVEGGREDEVGSTAVGEEGGLDEREVSLGDLTLSKALSENP